MDKPDETVEDEPKATKIPIRDRRKLREDDPPAAEIDADESIVPPEDPGQASADADGPASESELSKAQADAAGYLEDLQRLKADFDNYRKRVLKEQTQLVESAAVGLVSRLLAVLDNFELAVAAAEETKDFDRMLKGVEMVFGELKEVLKAEGLQLIEAKGRTFDPNLHEAALEVPGDDSGHLVVGEVLRPGYMFKGRVLRPAMVKVTQRKDES